MEMRTTHEQATQNLKDVLKGMLDHTQNCIQDCVSAHQICEQTIAHCLERGGAHAGLTHIRLLEDCSDICAISSDLMLRKSELHKAMCSICAESCRSCAASCEELAGPDDEMMNFCAKICRACSESCQEMAQAQ
jgi:hypothetical protein